MILSLLRAQQNSWEFSRPHLSVNMLLHPKVVRGKKPGGFICLFRCLEPVLIRSGQVPIPLDHSALHVTSVTSRTAFGDGARQSVKPR